MHILFICPSFPDFKNHLHGIFYEDQASALKQAGSSIGVIQQFGLGSICFSRDTLRNWRNQLNYIINGIPVYRSIRTPIPIKKSDNSIRLWSILTPAWNTYKRYIAKYGIPDIIHAHNFFYAGIAGLTISQKTKIPVVLTEHSSLFLIKKLPKDKEKILKSRLLEINKVLAVSSKLAAIMKSYVKDCNINVIGNIVDTDFFRLNTYENPEKRFNFTTIAHLDQNKNVGFTIKAFHLAFSGKKDVRLNICGSGLEKERLINLVNRLNLNSQVRFQDILSRQELLRLYQRSHVVLSSSEHETFGLTLAEAMACGIPIIATRSGGPEDFVNAEVGFLVEKGDLAGMAEAMKHIFKNYRNYDRENIRNYCMQNYSKDVIVKKIMRIYLAENKKIKNRGELIN